MDASLGGIGPYLTERPSFCFTTDIEWAPEWAIEDLFALADAYEIRLTPFLTHRSEYLWRRFGGARASAAGVHPNFLPGSTHGESVGAVIDHVARLWPAARAFRSHCFYDETRMNRKMADRGFRYDSNLCAFLQTGLVPLRTATRIIRFPVFWEDDVHSGFGLPWTIEAIDEELRSPGLKIFNVHPPRVALNIADEEFYESRRSLFRETALDPAAHASVGAGTRTFLESLFAYARTMGHPVVTLEELYEQALSRGVPRAESV
ncbi:MAG TPA: hypothetical protein VIN69_07505 [Candidatus Limnocylindria bacterium]|jgi:hypothetical protein